MNPVPADLLAKASLVLIALLAILFFIDRSFRDRNANRYEKFRTLLDKSNVDISGPAKCRHGVWHLPLTGDAFKGICTFNPRTRLLEFTPRKGSIHRQRFSRSLADLHEINAFFGGIRVDVSSPDPVFDPAEQTPESEPTSAPSSRHRFSFRRPKHSDDPPPEAQAAEDFGNDDEDPPYAQPQTVYAPPPPAYAAPAVPRATSEEDISSFMAASATPHGAHAYEALDEDTVDAELAADDDPDFLLDGDRTQAMTRPYVS